MLRRLARWSLRSKIIALLGSLVMLWVFAAWVTAREGLNLLAVSQVDRALGRPAATLITELQEERRLSLIRLGQADGANLRRLEDQRRESDKAIAEFRESAGKGGWAVSDDQRGHIAEITRLLDALPKGRQSVDQGSTPRIAAARPYDAVIDVTLKLTAANSDAVDDKRIAGEGLALVSLLRAREILAREDALLSGVLAAGRFANAEHATFTGLVNTQRYLFVQAVDGMPDGARAAYQRLTSGAGSTRLTALEDQIIQRARTGTRLNVTPAQWQAAVHPMLEQVDRIVQDGGDEVVEHSQPMAIGVIARLIAAGGLGLLAVIASVVMSITTARDLVRQLERLREAAWDLANNRLPSVVERLGHGEKVDVAAEAPPLRFGDDQIGQVGRAFNAVQETAIATAVQQAELRTGFRKILLALARRNQALVTRQLRLIDGIERRRDLEGEELQEIFRLDHLATRMRRNAENLVLMAGENPARSWKNPVPVFDVVRAAVGEVEDYERVTFQRFDTARLAGRAVVDVTRLLAELIENGLNFSSPGTEVVISGQTATNGYAIEIEDKGLGMRREQLEEANQMLMDPPEFDLAPDERLGLFVVGRLARRYRVTVSLKRSPYGGVTAVVLIPNDLIGDQPPEDTRQSAVTTGPTAVSAGGDGPADLGHRAAVAVLPAPSDPHAEARPGPQPPLAPVPGTPSGSAPRPAGQPGDRPSPASPSGTHSGPPSGTHSGPQPLPLPHSPGGEPGRPMSLAPPPAASPVPETAGDTPRPAETAVAQPMPLPTTPGGLPIRQPQEHLVEQLRTDAPLVSPAEPEEEDDDRGRSPEEIRKLVGSFQQGTLRGRAAAQRRPSKHAPDDDATPA
ncbi:Signal transduction histidine kinase [Thermomonospora echinospora]|uniref:histidine kinase n=1 Tax=Thermomonospora echinospora TaxID=1992 RepID=A0A1H5VL96_9ACTN|nr:nitrate- and nitrite sensing domain-containing protein [Thermomonospora echinospora]SEF87796.1 Signal transduction histidine kinase [Thermomonospora echinospora]